MQDSTLKRWLLKVWFEVQDGCRLHYIRKHYSLSIMTAEKTIAYIKRHRCSIARYGDGEFAIMLQRGAPGFQKGSEEMAAAMLAVFENPSDRLLICLPHALVSTKGFEPWAKAVWEGWARSNQREVVQHICKLIGNDYCFGDAYISRPFTAYKSKLYAAKMFSCLKELWTGRDILIVEGAQTRLGVGNDLFSRAKSIKRILGPSENAFDNYSEIYNAVCSNWQGELVILALGPTATILASDLSKTGIQALDLGHIDIQYEWFLKNDKTFKPVASKYTNEAVGGQQVEYCADEKYLAQIIGDVS